MDFVAIDGGPCGGKSTILARAKRHLEECGYHVLVMEEAATLLMRAGMSPRPNEWRHPLDFQRQVLDYMLEQHRQFMGAGKRLATTRRLVVLCDRGIPGIAAYVGREALIQLLHQRGLTLGEVMTWYLQVIHMVTAADGAEAHYTLDNNAARTETPEQARQLDKLTQHAWHGHLSLAVVPNTGKGFEMKVREALNVLTRRLGIHRQLVPVERERSFEFERFRYDMLPDSAVRSEITQTYLTELLPGHERRVRKVVCQGAATHYFAEKIGAKVTGKRDEIQRIIEPREYEDLLRQRDRQYETIVKTRYSFTHHNRHFEVDDFHVPVTGLYLVELEGVGMGETIEFPPEWGAMRERTQDPNYSNRAIAQGSLRSRAA